MKYAVQVRSDINSALADDNYMISNSVTMAGQPPVGDPIDPKVVTVVSKLTAIDAPPQTVVENATLTGGTFKVTNTEGFTSLTIHSTAVTLAQLNAASTTPIVINTPEGQLTITGYSNDATNKVGTVTYTYDPAGTSKDHSSGAVKDTVSVKANYAGGKEVSGNLVINITDTTPEAKDDARRLEYNTAAALPGNVYATGGTGDVADVPGADTATLTLIGAGSGTPTAAVASGTTSSNGTSVSGTYGTLVIGANGSYTYDLNETLNAVATLPLGGTLLETFSYQITDSDGDASTALLTISIRNSGVTVNNVTVNETDPYAKFEVNFTDKIKLELIDGTAKGGTTSPTDGTVDYHTTMEYSVDGSTWQTYTPASQIAPPPSGRIFVRVPIVTDSSPEGSHTFQLKVTDENSKTATGTGTIVDNQPPVANNDSRSTPEDTPVSGNVLSGSSGDVADSDPDSGDTLTVIGFTVGGSTYAAGAAATLAGVGSLTLAADGSYTFTPVADWNGNVPVVTYTVSDGTGSSNSSNSTATLTIAVTPVADIADDTATTLANAPVTTTVLGNDSFTGTPTITTTLPSNGTVTVNPDNTITYTPNTGFTGSDSYTYTVTSGGVTETATVNVTVANTPPVANNDSRSTPEDTPVSGNVIGSGGSGDVADSDPDSGDTLTVIGFTVGGSTYAAGAAATLAGVGSLTLAADGSYTFTPVADWNGNVPVVTYTVSDGTGSSNSTAAATLAITVTPVQDIADDTATTLANQGVTTSVLTNDSFEGTAVVTSTTPAAHGTVTVNAGGTITYTPNAGWTGTDSYTYTVTSGGVTETATVSVTVTNAPPVANNDSRSTPEDTPVSGNVLSGTGGDVADSDPDGNPLTVSGFSVGGSTYAAGATATLAGVGSLTPNADGSYTFTPVADWNGTVPVVTYTVSDGTGSSNSTATATLAITVTPVVDIAADSSTTYANAPVTTNVLTNDSFAGTPTITATSPANGTATVNPDGSITYTPDPGFSGSDSYTYTVTSGGVTESARVVVIVTPENPGSPAVPFEGIPPVPPITNLQPMNPFDRSPVMVDAGPFFGSERFDDVRRMPLPFHPIVYVNREVQFAQQQRGMDDPRHLSQPANVQQGDINLLSLEGALKADPNLFVEFAVRNSQHHASFLGNVVDGRLGRVSLSSDQTLPSPSLFETRLAMLLDKRLKSNKGGVILNAPSVTELAMQPEQETLAAGPDGAVFLAAAPGTSPEMVAPAQALNAPSFNDQLRHSASRLPLAGRQN